MADFYCLLSGLPYLTPQGAVGSEAVSTQMLRRLFEDEPGVTKKDEKMVRLFFLKGDCRNLLLLLADSSAELVYGGNYSKTELEEMIADALEDVFEDDPRFPGFMAEFVREYAAERNTPGYFAEDRLMLRYWNYLAQEGTGFVARWAEISMNIANIMTALICRQQGWNIEDYIYGDNDVTYFIKTYPNAEDFNLSSEVDYAKQLIGISKCNDPVEKERKIDALKWEWIEDETFLKNFDINALYAYLLKVEMLERWEMLDPEFGKQRFEQIVENLRSECQVPKEFTTYMPKEDFSSKNEGTYNKSEK